MRDYHIYRQTAKYVNAYTNYSLLRWLPFKYVCTVSGTKELFRLFNNRGFCDRWSLSFHNSFTYNSKVFKGTGISFWNIYEEKMPERFLIVDDRGKVRDYYELTGRYGKKNRFSYRHRPYQYRCFSNASEKRKSVTPSEVREIKDEYGITMLPIKPKRNRSPWDYERCSAISRGWKKQTKRRKQYKVKEVI